MRASTVHILSEGDRVESNGVSFSFYPSIPDIVGSTRSDLPTFGWDWMVFGRVFHSGSSSVGTHDAGVMCGVHEGRLHVVTLPEVGGPSLYQDAPVSDLDIKVKQRKALFGKPRLEMVGITLSPEFGFAAQVANRLSATGEPDIADRLNEFADLFKQAT